ncbi:MAG: uncharacterized protein A8A55_3537, partial [Amphiamblys sp. WSBS2006]
MNQKEFLSVFLSRHVASAPVRIEALTAASMHTAAELCVLARKREERLNKTTTPEETVLFGHELAVYRFALAAKEAWEKTPSFKKMVPFPPSRVGDNPGTIKGLFKVVAEKIVAKKEELKEFVSLRKVKSIYAKWKQGFLDLMQK